MEPDVDFIFMDFENSLGSGTFHEVVTLRKANSKNEIRMREEKHIKAKESA